MTKADAIVTGQNMAIRFGIGVLVYRLPAWPPDVYGCIGADRGLPPEAVIVERLAADGTPSAPVVDPAQHDDAHQGDLFS